MAADRTLTADRLREVLDYDPATGVFRRLRSWGGSQIGEIAGCITSQGYRVISVDNVTYFAHRLAWLYVHGVWPAAQIDHINRVHDDNRIVNLRGATDIQNAQNVRGPQRNNTSGFLGVDYSGRRRGCRQWRAQIQVDGGKRHFLGWFATAEEASAAYLVAKRELHPFWAEADIGP